VAEHPEVLTPAMVNLDGFHLTHTYEPIDVPAQDAVDAFLPPFETPNRMSLERPTNLGVSSTPADNMEFKYQQHAAMLAAAKVIVDVEDRFASFFGRRGAGLSEGYRAEDAEIVLVTLGSVTGTVRTVVDALREEGVRVGLLKLRYLRPFPEEDVRRIAASARVLGVLEKDISFGYEGTVFTNVASAVAKGGDRPILRNFVAGLGGRNISRDDIAGVFRELAAASAAAPGKSVRWVNLGVATDA
jgi:pyruvate ferredoxin oxidoreductase alpha subunit